MQTGILLTCNYTVCKESVTQLKITINENKIIKCGATTYLYKVIFKDYKYYFHGNKFCSLYILSVFSTVLFYFFQFSH
jgi:hypothetical protein